MELTRNQNLGLIVLAFFAAAVVTSPFVALMVLWTAASIVVVRNNIE